MFLLQLLFSKILLTSSSNPLDLLAQLESLCLAADHAAGFIIARGAVPVARLHDILNRVREVTLHGVR